MIMTYLDIYAGFCIRVELWACRSPLCPVQIEVRTGTSCYLWLNLSVLCKSQEKSFGFMTQIQGCHVTETAICIVKVFINGEFHNNYSEFDMNMTVI